MIKLIENGASAGGGTELEIDFGVEFDTGDLREGATIYGKYISFGSLPNNGVTNVAHGIVTLGNIMKVDFIADNGTTQLQVAYAASDSPRLTINQTNLILTTNNNLSPYSGRCLMTYTKV